MKTTKIPLVIKVVSLYFVVGTIIAIGAAYYTNATHSQAIETIERQTLATQTQLAASPITTPVSGQPIHIDIERLDIHLRVNNGQYNKKTHEWSLAPSVAQYATITKQPNNTSGSTLIYGHNTINVFEPTKDLLAGDQLTITTDNGYTFIYTYTGSNLVNPTDTTILSAHSAKPQLTLLTCSGWLSDHRRLMFFDFVGVEK